MGEAEILGDWPAGGRGATAPQPHSRPARSYEHASVLFSGGTDSALAAVEMLKSCRKVTLLTFDPGYVFFVQNSRVHADALMRRYGEDRVEHLIRPIPDIVRRILFPEVKGDLRRYGPDMTALVCMGCRLSMHTAAIIHNLEHGIPVLADGSIEKQSAIPEQRQAVIEANRKRYLEQYGILHVSPIYLETRSDLKLFQEGVAPKANLKKQFIFFDTQATCVFGVPADVYARMFYKPLMGASTDIQSVEYCRERYPLMQRVVEEHFASQGADLPALVSRLRAMHEGPPGAAVQATAAPAADRAHAGRQALGVVSFMRLVGRYAIATAMIPVGVALGIAGLAQFALRQRKPRGAGQALDDGARAKH